MKATSASCASSAEEENDMKISMNWIRQYADIPVTPAEYESRMIMHGTAV